MSETKPKNPSGVSGISIASEPITNSVVKDPLDIAAKSAPKAVIGESKSNRVASEKKANALTLGVPSMLNTEN